MVPWLEDQEVWPPLWLRIPDGLGLNGLLVFFIIKLVCLPLCSTGRIISFDVGSSAMPHLACQVLHYSGVGFGAFIQGGAVNCSVV